MTMSYTYGSTIVERMRHAVRALCGYRAVQYVECGEFLLRPPVVYTRQNRSLEKSIEHFGGGQLSGTRRACQLDKKMTREKAHIAANLYSKVFMHKFNSMRRSSGFPEVSALMAHSFFKEQHRVIVALVMEKKRLTKVIGFDLDGVIVDHTDLKIELAASCGWKLRREETPAAVLPAVVPVEVLEEIRRIYSEPEIALRASLMEGARVGIERVRASHTPYFLISRRRIPAHAIKLLALRGLWPSIFNETNAFFVTTPEEKNECAKRLGITHYVDDEYDVLEKLVDVRERFLFDPLGVWGHINKYPRLTSWNAIIEYLLN